MAEKLVTAKTEEKAKELEEEAKKVELKTKKELKPWEQHSAVITIPRFDYNAPSSLPSHSHSGFLITCPIKREKSATKEAMSILEKYVRSLSILNAEGSESLDVNMSAKKRRISVSTEKELGNSLERKDAADDFGEPEGALGWVSGIRAGPANLDNSSSTKSSEGTSDASPAQQEDGTTKKQRN
ncbi:uncharacterized protein LOC113753062 isoform X2 [Coffea eugenioides]|uniref:uncharacterized protein LOC113753062 isoform X2 n=1 Tax=Coffea eugenioides TaxID=49369 RepID=UPI000F608760|nr:uncharacterized protein LOC113753062 isoform X2 [Coffea eugenioides]